MYRNYCRPAEWAAEWYASVCPMNDVAGTSSGCSNTLAAASNEVQEDRGEARADLPGLTLLLKGVRCPSCFFPLSGRLKYQCICRQILVALQQGEIPCGITIPQSAEGGSRFRRLHLSNFSIALNEDWLRYRRGGRQRRFCSRSNPRILLRRFQTTGEHTSRIHGYMDTDRQTDMDT